MPETFRSLASMVLEGGPSAEDDAAPPRTDEHTDVQPVQEACREARLFAARLHETVGALAARMLEDIAADVLARELRMAPVDIACVIERAIARCLIDEPIRVRAHPDEASAVACGIPVVADERLRRGDAVLELRDGLMDCTLGARLSTVLHAAAC